MSGEGESQGGRVERVHSLVAPRVPPLARPLPRPVTMPVASASARTGGGGGGVGAGEGVGVAVVVGDGGGGGAEQRGVWAHRCGGGGGALDRGRERGEREGMIEYRESLLIGFHDHAHRYERTRGTGGGSTCSVNCACISAAKASARSLCRSRFWPDTAAVVTWSLEGTSLKRGLLAEGGAAGGAVKVPSAARGSAGGWGRRVREKVKTVEWIDEGERWGVK